MSDLIRREDVYAIITKHIKDAVGDEQDVILEAYAMAHRHISEVIQFVPAVDAVEVVRCRECKAYSEKSQMCREWSKHGTVPTIPAGFCYLGKRREDGDGDG